MYAYRLGMPIALAYRLGACELGAITKCICLLHLSIASVYCMCLFKKCICLFDCRACVYSSVVHAFLHLPYVKVLCFQVVCIKSCASFLASAIRVRVCVCLLYVCVCTCVHCMRVTEAYCPHMYGVIHIHTHTHKDFTRRIAHISIVWVTTYLWCGSGVGLHSRDICMVYFHMRTHKHITGGREAASCLPAKRRRALVVLPGNTSHNLSASVCVYVQMCAFVCINICVCDGYLHLHTYMYT